MNVSSLGRARAPLHLRMGGLGAAMACAGREDLVFTSDCTLIPRTEEVFGASESAAVWSTVLEVFCPPGLQALCPSEFEASCPPEWEVFPSPDFCFLSCLNLFLTL